MQEVAPCHLFTLKDTCLVRKYDSMNQLTYQLWESKGDSVQMIGFKKGADFRHIYPLGKGSDEASCGLPHLALLRGADTDHLVRWCSKWGLVGTVCTNWQDANIEKKLARQSDMSLYHRVCGGISGSSPYGEPVELIREAARVAHAATALYLALQQKQPSSRAVAMHQILEKGPVLVEGDDGGPTLREDRILGVSIGLSESPFPRRAPEFIRRGWEALHDLMETYLNPSLKLQCDPSSDPERPNFYWQVDTLFGALFLKMLRAWRKQRWCTECKKDITHRRPQATTCGEACKQARKYRRKKERAVESSG